MSTDQNAWVLGENISFPLLNKQVCCISFIGFPVSVSTDVVSFHPSPRRLLGPSCKPGYPLAPPPQRQDDCCVLLYQAAFGFALVFVLFFNKLFICDCKASILQTDLCPSLTSKLNYFSCKDVVCSAQLSNAVKASTPVCSPAQRAIIITVSF